MAMGVSLGKLCFGASIILGDDMAGRAIKEALTPLVRDYVDYVDYVDRVFDLLIELCLPWLSFLSMPICYGYPIEDWLLSSRVVH